MSAIERITDSSRTSRHVRFAPNCDMQLNSIHWLFDYVVGAAEQRRRHGEAERFRGLEVDHQFELFRGLNWQLARLRALEDAIGIDCRAPEIIEYFNSIGEQAAGF